MLRPLRTDATAVLVWPDDPAVDPDHMVGDTPGAKLCATLEHSARDPGSWRTLLRMRDGQQPTEFVIGTVPPSTLVRIEDDAAIGSEAPRYQTLGWECFCAALVDVRNCAGLEVKKTPKGRVDRKWIEENMTGDLLRAAVWVGLIVWKWNQFSEADAKNS